jgi:hypothetical protein
VRILAIDPGNEQSAYVWMCDGNIGAFGKMPNDEMLRVIDGKNSIRSTLRSNTGYDLAVEGIASYGMAVGKEVFDTCIWIGRYLQHARPDKYRLIYRMEVKNHLCHSSKANDSNIRQALIDRFGGPQEIKKGGKLYGISKDVWSALAVAVTYLDKIIDERKEAEHA